MFNNKTKTFLLLTLIFVTLLGVSAATAATIDNNATDTTSTSQEAVSQAADTVSDHSIPTTTVSNKEINKNTQNNVKTEGEGTFADLTTDITDSEVTLKKDYIQGSGEEAITIDGEKTIDGDGHTITASNTIFTLPATSNVTFKNIIFTGNTNNKVLINLAGNLSLKNVTFDGINTTNQNLINPTKTDTNISLEDVTVKDFIGGSIIRSTYARLKLNMTNSEFIHNNASFSPIQINGVGWKLNISSSNFVDNIGQNGGVIQVLSKNTPQIYIDDCTFDSNIATGRAGVLSSSGNNAIISVTNSKFTDNNVLSTSSSNLASVIIINNQYTNLTLSNNEMSGSTAINNTYIYIENINKIYTDAKLIAENAKTGKDQLVDLKFKLVDDMGNNIGFKEHFVYNATLNDEIISYIPDVYYGKIYGFTATANKTINASYEPGKYPITLTVGKGEDKFDSLEIVNGELYIKAPPAEITLKDENYLNYFNEDGTIIEEMVPEDSTLYFDGTFKDRKFNITIPLTMDTAENQAIFDNCTIVVNDKVTVKNIEVLSIWGPNYNNYVDTIANYGDLALNNVSFKYNTDVRTYGSYINMYAKSNLTAVDCVFDGGNTNRAIIYASGARANMNFDNCLFTNYNTSNSGIYMLSASQNTNLTVKNSNFTNGVTTGYGGAIQSYHLSQLVDIDNCLFENLTVDYRGGAMYLAGNATVKNSKFKNLTNARETYNAGAIWLNTNYASLYLENNMMEDIKANAADIVINNAGGIVNSTVNIIAEDISVDQEDDTTIMFNVTDDKGNTIDMKGAFAGFTVTNDTLGVEETYTFDKVEKGSLIKEYHAALDPGVYKVTLNYDDTKLTGTVNVPEITLTINDIGLYKYSRVQSLIDAAEEGSTVTIEGSVIRGSTEEKIVISKDITLDFIGNYINAKNGRIFEIKDDAIVTIKNTEITNVGNPESLSTQTDGRIANITSASLTFENVSFVDNMAPSNGYSYIGSFIFLFEDSDLKLINCTIENSTGTFINNVESNVIINRTIFKNNNLYKSYSESWAALIANGGKLDITDSEFIDNRVNTAVINGNSNAMSFTIPMKYNGPLTITNTKFINNYASSGKGAAINTQNDTLIKNSTFINNTQNSYSNKGGAVRSEDGALTIEDSLFVNNTARNNDGSAISNEGGDLTIKNSIIITNLPDVSSVYNGDTSANVQANNNYWGTNDPQGLYKGFTIDNWVILNVTVDPEENIKYNDEITVKATLNQVTDGTTTSNLEGTLPDYGTVTFTAKGGDITEATVEMKDGQATTKMKVTNSPFTITATYPETEAVYNGEAKMPEPQIITLNDGNWTYYFNEEDGTVNTDRVVPNSELRFEGEFNNRDMVITIPLNLTTADKQAVLNNCTITVTEKASGTIIKDLEMKATDYTDALITLENTENVIIENNKLTNTNNGAKQLTRAINVDGGENNIIRNNIIDVVGPEEDIVYAGDSMSDVEIIYTAAISAENSKALTVDSNVITTTKNDKNATTYGTIYGVYVTGDKENPVSDIQITNNEITITGDVYAYALVVNSVEESTIDNNTITTTSKKYANGIQLGSCADSTVSNNDITVKGTEFAYGILNNGAMDWDTYDTYPADSNLIKGNVIYAESKNAQGIQIFLGEYNEVTYNNITINADNGVGVGIADASYGDIKYNNIEITATMNTTAGVGDAIKFDTAGVKVQPSGQPMHSSYGNSISFNNITVDAPSDSVPAVNITINSEVTDNYLVAPMGMGDSAVLSTASAATIEDNRPISLSNITTDEESYEFSASNKPLVEVTINYDDTVTELGVLNVYVDDEKEPALTIDAVASFEYLSLEQLLNNIKNVKDSYNITLEYVNPEVVTNKTSFKLDVTRENVSIKYDILNDVEGKVAIELTVLDKEGNEIDSLELLLTSDEGLNASVKSGKNFKDSSLTPGEYSINVNFAGNAYYEAANETITLKVKEDPDKIIEDLNNTNKELADNLTKAQEDINDLEQANNNLTKELNDTNAKLDEANSKVDNLTSANKKLADDVAAANKKIDDLTKANNDLNNKLADANNKVDNLTSANKKLADDVAAANKKVNDLSKANDDLAKQLNDTTKRVDDLAKAVDNLNKQLNDTQNKVNDLNKEVADKDKTIKELTTKKATKITVDKLNATSLGSSIVITGKVTDATGKALNNMPVSIKINAATTKVVTNANGVYKYTTTAHTIGTNNVTVSSIANDKYTANSAKTTFKVNKAKPTLKINAISAVKFKDTLTITGTLTDANGKALPSVNVTVKVNSKSANVKTAKDGSFKYTTKATSMGTNNVTATYNGNAKYNKATAKTTFKVVKQNLVLTVDRVAASVKFKDDLAISGKLVDGNGKAVMNTQVTIKINDKTYKAKTDKNGLYVLKTRATMMGANNVVASYAGNAKYNKATAKTSFNVAKQDLLITFDEVKYASGKVTVKGTFIDRNKRPLMNSLTRITLNGKQGTAKTNNKGTFTYTTKANKGAYKITLAYPGNARYNAYSKTSTISVA